MRRWNWPSSRPGNCATETALLPCLPRYERGRITVKESRTSVRQWPLRVMSERATPRRPTSGTGRQSPSSSGYRNASGRARLRRAELRGRADDRVPVAGETWVLRFEQGAALRAWHFGEGRVLVELEEPQDSHFAPRSRTPGHAPLSCSSSADCSNAPSPSGPAITTRARTVFRLPTRAEALGRRRDAVAARAARMGLPRTLAEADRRASSGLAGRSGPSDPTAAYRERHGHRLCGPRGRRVGPHGRWQARRRR